MTDFLPPDPTVFQPPVADTAVDPAAGEAAPPAPQAGGRGRRVAAIAAGVLGVGAAVAMVAVLAGRSGDSAGAGSAKDAVTQLADAISNEDVVGALTVLAPDEVNGLPQLVNSIKDKAKDQGIQGLGQNQGIDVKVDVKGLDETVLAPHASAITVDATVSAKATDVPGPVGAAIDGTHSTDLSLRLIVVQIDGGWYVSPMLTGMEAIAKSDDLPPGDYTKVDPGPVTTKTSDAKSAVEEFMRAAATQDLDALIDTVGPGEARVLRVFHDAAAELLADRDFQVTVDDVAATAEGDGAVLNHLALTIAHDDGTTQHADYRDGCLTMDDDEPNCLDDAGNLGMFVVDPKDLVMRVVEADGNHRVSLVGTVIGLAQRAMDQFDGKKFLGALGLEVYGDAAPIEVDKALKGTIDPTVGYAVYEFTAKADTSYVADTGDSEGQCYAQVYRSGDNQSWTPDYGDVTTGGPARVVVQCYGDSNDYEVTVTEGDGGFGPITGGSESVGETVTADLSNGPVTVTLGADYSTVTSMSVVVIPDAGQDISIASPDCAECGEVNDDTAGGAEYLFFDLVTPEGVHEVTITPIGPSDATGTVTIQVNGF